MNACTTAIFPDTGPFTAWQERPVLDELPEEIYELAQAGTHELRLLPSARGKSRWGATSAIERSTPGGHGSPRISRSMHRP